jgi:hypothetical protein
MKFQPAVKFESHLKMGLSGPPGSGKSYTSLMLASQLSKKRIAVIDAEAGAAAKYAGVNGFNFDVLDMTIDDEGKEIAKPFTPKRYIEAIRAAHDSGEYDVLIIDGISPEWDDAGGCLQTVDELKRKYSSDNEKAATRNAWSVVTPFHKDFVNLILRVKMHVICTMLARKEEVVTKDSDGRITGRKKTLEPIQREGIERVFDIFAKMEERDMVIDKTRCPELEDQIYHKPGKEVADIIREWLKGEPVLEHPEYEPEPVHEIKLVTPDPEGQNAPATEQQVSSLKKFCTHLERAFPIEWSTLSYVDAKARIVQLSAEYNEMRQDKSQPIESAAHETGQVSSSLQRMIDMAQARVEKLQPAETWATIKATALGKVVQDSEIVVSDFTKINGLITKLEREKVA